jgi:PKD repeat protein
MKKVLLNLSVVLSTSLAGVFTAHPVAQQLRLNQFDNKPYVAGEMLVQTSSRGEIRRIVAGLPTSLEATILEEVSKPMRVWLIKFNPQAIAHDAMMDLLYSQKEVTLVDYNYYVEMRSTIPNDPQFNGSSNQQWHHYNTGQTGGTPDADIDSDEAWDITTGGTSATGEDIVVCIIESTNLNHTDLDANKWVNPFEIAGNGIDDDGNGYIDDVYGWNPGGNNGTVGYGSNTTGTSHGTNCAGMMGAVGNNSVGVAGANWDLKIMIVTVGNLTQANVISSYTYPLVQRQRWNTTNGAQGAFVVATSASWGIDQANPANYPLWCNFYDTLGKYGIISVGATSNSNVNVDTQGDMPTACSSPYMVGVGRTDHDDNTAGGYGVNTIDFGAPGINVRTTANSNAYTTTTGTSFSCPLTAGVVALAYSIPCPSFMALVKSDPQLGADIVLQALLDGVDQKSQLANRFITGGRLNAKNTLDELMAVSCSGTFCLAPSAPTVSNITNAGATITWNAFASADSYNFYYREAGASTWISQSLTSTTTTLAGLDACTSYEFYLESICDGDPSTAGATVTFSTIGCGNCVDLSYCTANATDGVDEWIASVSVGTFTHTSGNDQGYGNHTGIGSIALNTGQSYPLSITIGFGGQAYNEYSRVWIDLNQNGTFETTELVYNQGAATQTTATGTITIPTTATLGSTRMRVIMAYQGQGQTTLPGVCGSFQWGEVEDYCVTITQAVICNYNVTNTVTQPTCSPINNGAIAVNVSGADAPYSYVWNGSAGSASQTGLAAGNYTLVITDNSGCDTTINYTLSNTVNLGLTVTPTNASCNGVNDGSATATATGSSGYAYQWTGGPSSATYTSLAAGTYNVQVTDGNGCTASSSATITEPDPIQASFTSLENMLTVTFTNTSSAGSYNWTFGDGNTSIATNPVHTYAEKGVYNVCLSVTNSCGNVSTCRDLTIDNVTGINEEVITLLSIYPNPVSEVLFVRNDTKKPAFFSIIDVNGRLIKTVSLRGELTEVSIKELSNALYFYQVRDLSGNVLQTDKFSVVK